MNLFVASPVQDGMGCAGGCLGSPGALGPRAGEANTVEVRVIDNNGSPVQVYVRDATGKLHRMGTEAPTHVEILEIPREISDRDRERLISRRRQTGRFGGSESSEVEGVPSVRG